MSNTVKTWESRVFFLLLLFFFLFLVGVESAEMDSWPLVQNHSRKRGGRRGREREDDLLHERYHPNGEMLLVHPIKEQRMAVAESKFFFLLTVHQAHSH